MRRRLSRLKPVILLGLLAFALARWDYDTSVLVEVSTVLVGFSLVVFMTWQLSLAQRWRYCVQRVQPGGPSPKALQLLAVLWLGNLVSVSVLPSMIGNDAVKLVMWKSVASTLGKATQSIAMLRHSGNSGIVLVGLLSLLGSIGLG